MVRPIVALIAACTLFQSLVSAEVFAQQRPTVDKLVATFDDVVFGAEIDATMRATVVAKWQAPLRVSVKGQAKEVHINYLRKHLERVLSLTGLEMGDVSQDDPAETENVSIAFVPEDQLSKITIKGVEPRLIQTLAGPRTCYFLSFRDPPSDIIRSIIVVNNERSSRAINHCLLEEVLQSIGLPNDSDLIRPSLFSDRDSVIAVTRSDEILVRALYDPRLEPGTPREAALEVVRGIIEELDQTLPPE